jgi:hypothetical protein
VGSVARADCSETPHATKRGAFLFCPSRWALTILLSDINELKAILEIAPDNTTEDKKLWFFVEYASDLIEELLDRRGMSFAARTQYYDGSGTPLLRLRSRPVHVSPEIQVYVDEQGGYGQVSGSFDSSTTALTYGTDFYLKLSPDDATRSRSGLLVRHNNFWNKRSARQRGLLAPFVAPGFGSIKVVYSGGYTVEDLPPAFRAATNLLVARLRYLFPLGMPIGSESYEERHISLLDQRKDYLMSLVRPMILSYRNWSF